jgi:hypothetical protein
MIYACSFNEGADMPATSQAAQRRKAAGLEPEKDPSRVERGIKGAAARHKKTEEQLRAKQAKKHNGIAPKGGAMAAVMSGDSFLAKLQSEKELTRIRVGAIATRNAEKAVMTLVSLMNNSDGDVPAAVRRLAALDIIAIAGAGSEAQQAAEKELHDMTAAELQAFIQAGRDQLARQQSATVEGDYVEIPLDTSPEAAPDQAQPPD